MKCKDDRINLIISPTEKGFLEMSKVFEFISIFLPPMFEIETFGKHFRFGSQDLFKMIDPKNQKNNADQSPEKRLFPLSEEEINSKKIDTLNNREKSVPKNPYENESPKYFLPNRRKSLCFESKGMKRHSPSSYYCFRRVPRTRVLFDHNGSIKS